MAPTYKLHYFNIDALGEPARYLLAYGKANWEDVRYNSPKSPEWEKVKSTMPFGQLPVLEVDGKQYAQSVAIAKYLGKQFGLAGKDDLENLQIDAVASLFIDFTFKFGFWRYEQNPESNAAKKATLVNEQIPNFLNMFEETVKANGGFLVNGKLTWADIFLAAPIGFYLSMVGKDLKDYPYPGLQALVKKVESIPEIASYIAKRPARPAL